MKIFAKILEKNTLKAVFKQIRKLTPHLLIHPFTHLPFILCSAIGGLSFVLITGCNTTEPPTPPPPPEKPKAVKLKLLDVSCTEAFISVSANDTVLPVSIILNKDEKALFNFTLTKTDTTVIDTTLVPNKTYIYQTTEEINGEEEKSDTLNVTTLDTTSNNFTWQSFTFGDPDAGSSTLNDVAVISPDNIWAVGAIYLKDSTGKPDPTPYSIAHWDGITWKLKKLYYRNKDYQGNYYTAPLVDIKGILAFSSTDIWLAPGSVFHWDGKDSLTEFSFNRLSLINKQDSGKTVTKLWGTSSSDIYGVGNVGTIVHYQNGSWIKIESGTDLTIHDIWGINNNEQTKILAVASEIFEVKGKKILSINSTGVTELPNNGLSWSMVTVWFSNEFREYAGGGGLYTRYSNENSWKEIPIPLYYTYSIRGNGLNDIVVCGGNGYFGHFNGVRWINYLGNGLSEISGNYYSSSIKGNTVTAVGVLSNGKAIAVIGKR